MALYFVSGGGTEWSQCRFFVFLASSAVSCVFLYLHHHYRSQHYLWYYCWHVFRTQGLKGMIFIIYKDKYFLIIPLLFYIKNNNWTHTVIYFLWLGDLNEEHVFLLSIELKWMVYWTNVIFLLHRLFFWHQYFDIHQLIYHYWLYFYNLLEMITLYIFSPQQSTLKHRL